jgi:arginyl-tRNA synthetase
MNLFAHFKGVLIDILNDGVAAGELPGELDFSRIVIEPPRDPSHGDITTNAAMVLAKPAKKNPREVAAGIASRLEHNEHIDKVEIAGPGFINMKLATSFWMTMLATALKEGDAFGRSDVGGRQKVNVEYVSANPTGPLHVGHCRGAVFGDALASLLEETGYDVTREYYINDAGAQVEVLARSAWLRYLEALGEEIGVIPEGLYPGDYLKPVGQALKNEFGETLKEKSQSERLAIIQPRAITMMMDMIRDDLAALEIRQDVFFSEKSLHGGNDGKVGETLALLEKMDLIYQGSLEPPKGVSDEERENWDDRIQTLFKSKECGDDTDRPLLKSDGSYTYFASDVAYARDKIERGFKQLIFVLGADHGGYVKRLQAVVKALSGGDSVAIVRLCQLVHLYRGGEPVKMSKRSGNFVTLRDVVDEVGSDVVRFIMLYRKNEAPLDFDFQKVTEQSRDNPVFYVQYAHARICSVFRNASNELGDKLKCKSLTVKQLAVLDDEAEMTVIRKLAEYPRVLEAAALAHEPHRVAFYLYELAADFHSLWNKGKDKPNLRFIVQTSLDVTLARLELLRAIRYILANGMRVLGVTPVKEM